jgi:hypothetical protein
LQAVQLQHLKVMTMNIEEKILTETRRRTFIRADRRGREEENRQDTRHTLDALQEVTGLPRRELEAIAADVRAFYEPEEKDFFSVKNQFLMVSSGLALICLSIWTFILIMI